MLSDLIISIKINEKIRIIQDSYKKINKQAAYIPYSKLSIKTQLTMMSNLNV